PAVLKTSPAEIEAGVARVLESYGRGPGHVFNLGHGITPDVPPEHVAVLVEAVHRLSPAGHRSRRRSEHRPRPNGGTASIPAERASPARLRLRSALRGLLRVAQRAAQDLADVGLGQLVAELDGLRDLVAREVLAAVREDGFLGQ